MCTRVGIPDCEQEGESHFARWYFKEQHRQWEEEQKQQEGDEE